jgi:putative flippase GtrA
MWTLAGELFRYGLVGASSSVVDFLSYVGFTRVAHLGALSANVLAYLVGHVISFIGNRKFTFRSKGHLGGEYMRFWAVNLAGLVVSQAALYIGLRYGMNDLYAKIIAIVGSGFLNYLLSRHWTFRKAAK